MLIIKKLKKVIKIDRIFLGYHTIYTLLEKRMLKFFFFLSIFGMLLEMLSISIIIPLLYLLTDYNYSLNILDFLLKNFNLNISNKELIVLSAFLILITFSIKTFFLTYVSYKQISFLINLKINITNKLFALYLKKPFIFHVNKNSSTLIRNLEDSTQILIYTKSVLNLFTESTVVSGLLVLLLFNEPIGTIFATLFITIFGCIFYFFVRNKALLWGLNRQSNENSRLELLQNSFRFIKDIKILNKEDYFINTFSKKNILTNSSQLKQDFTLSLPRLWFEFITVFGFIILIIILLSFEEKFKSIIPILGFFAVVTFRTIPSITKILNAFQHMRFAYPVSKNYIQEFKDFSLKEEINDSNIYNFKFLKKIEIKNIKFSYPQSKKIILNNINFEILKGSSVGILGNSGVGKTTLLNIIIGLLDPDEGQIIIDGENLVKFKREWQDKIGYVPQNIYLSDDNIKKNIALGFEEELIDMKKIDYCLKASRLTKFLSELPYGLDSKLGEFGDKISGGQKQRIGIARALYNNPEILILDEYTNSLDPKTEEEVVNEINMLKKEKTILTISHKDSTLRLCDNIYQLTKEKEILKIK
jgi:ABC-type bacteriocin/lantibiotic exporter with double-glycine peptidase domain